MRFYYLTLTLFLQALTLVAQPIDAVKLSSEQIALIKNSGATGIQKVFAESGIEIQDLPSVEAFAFEVVSGQLINSSTTETTTGIASSAVVALAEIASTENFDASYVIEYVSAGIAQGLTTTALSNNLDVFQLIASASESVVSSAIQYSLDKEFDIDKAVSAAGSGYLAGTIQASSNIGIDIVKAVKASSSGLIVGSINATVNNNVEIYDTLSSTCEGVAEAAVEGSVIEQLDLIKQIAAATLGAGKSAAKTATTLSLEINLIQKAILNGLKRGTADSIPGKGNNIRIIIVPQKQININELIQAIENGIIKGGMQEGYIPIVETPLEDSPEVRQVSPTY